VSRHAPANAGRRGQLLGDDLNQTLQIVSIHLRLPRSNRRIFSRR
jgi:hypothetical protein